MAKTSKIAAQRRREKVVATYALERAELKERQRRTTSPAQRREAQEALCRLPRDASPVRLRAVTSSTAGPADTFESSGCPGSGSARWRCVASCRASPNRAGDRTRPPAGLGDAGGPAGIAAALVTKNRRIREGCAPMDHHAGPDFTAMAQFYDLLMRETVAARITHLLEGLLTATGAAPQDGVLDVAAGSGVMAQTLAHRFPTVPVTAVEPSAAMRVALWTTMASDPLMRAAVRVLPIVAEDMRVRPVHDLALCMWAMHNFRPFTRTQVWRRIRDGLTPGGRLLIEKPAEAHARPSTLAEHELGRTSIGTDTITLTASTRPTGPQTQDWTFRYHLTDQAGATMGQWLGGGESWRVGNDDLVAELHDAGFSIETTLDDLTSNGQDAVGQVYVARL